jgi:hypothetical protein
LFLAYIAGLATLGLSPRTTLEIPGGERRLDRILDLIRRCPFSVHDLPDLLRNAGAKSCFKARVFDDLCVLARSLSDLYVV